MEGKDDVEMDGGARKGNGEIKRRERKERKGREMEE